MSKWEDLKLTREEKELFESFKQGGWKSILIPEIKKYNHELRLSPSANKNNQKLHVYLEKSISKKLRAMAGEEGVSYKDLAVSVLQKFANS